MTEGGGKIVSEDWCLVRKSAVTRRFQAVGRNAKCVFVSAVLWSHEQVGPVLAKGVLSLGPTEVTGKEVRDNHYGQHWTPTDRNLKKKIFEDKRLYVTIELKYSFGTFQLHQYMIKVIF